MGRYRFGGKSRPLAGLCRQDWQRSLDPARGGTRIGAGAQRLDWGGWVFPSARDDSLPLCGKAAFKLRQRIAEKLELPEGARYGWHSFRWRFANDLRQVPLRHLCDLGGWKSAQTILTCYQQSDERAAGVLATRKKPWARLRRVKWHPRSDTWHAEWKRHKTPPAS
jgi:hypothetical protein